ncbi:MAG: (deoxy)nucleoside triphosphate pyrophosphohydrolase [Spirochaetaceae bacterium]|jgi:8-oxo-dGTP diphosphatase|nr:(deoxy)nucleoside triphosphate pyrophosphohydrolase [Spirochaetaceae bacterium]
MEKRSVAGIAMQQGKFFIARRRPGGALGEKWEFPGGKVEPGETDEAALLREYQEELEVPITVGPFLGSASFEYRGLHRVYAYQVRLEGYDFKLAEHTEYRWATLEEIRTLDFADSDRNLLSHLTAFCASNSE